MPHPDWLMQHKCNDCAVPCSVQALDLHAVSPSRLDAQHKTVLASRQRRGGFDCASCCAGAHWATAKSFHQPDRIVSLRVMAGSGQSQPRSRHAARMQNARAAITDSLLLRSNEQQEELVGTYDEMQIDSEGTMAKVRPSNEMDRRL